MPKQSMYFWYCVLVISMIDLIKYFLTDICPDQDLVQIGQYIHIQMILVNSMSMLIYPMEITNNILLFMLINIIKSELKLKFILYYEVMISTLEH